MVVVSAEVNAHNVMLQHLKAPANPDINASQEIILILIGSLFVLAAVMAVSALCCGSCTYNDEVALRGEMALRATSGSNGRAAGGFGGRAPGGTPAVCETVIMQTILDALFGGNRRLRALNSFSVA